MSYSIKGRKNLNSLVSLQNQVNDLRLQDKVGKQNYHENLRKIL